jgi:hypothetical protein
MMPGHPGLGRDPGPAGRTPGPGHFGGETRDHARRFTWATRPAQPAHEGARRCTPYRGSRALRNDVPVAKQMNGPVSASRDSMRLHWRMTTSSRANRLTASSLARLTRRAPLSRTAAISGARSGTCLSADMAPVGAWHKPPAIRAEPVNLSAPGRLRTLDHACKSGQAVRRQLDLSYILGMVMVRSASLASTGGRVCDGDRLCRVGMRVSWLRPWRAGLRE